MNSDGLGSFEVEGLVFRCVANGHSPESVSWRIAAPQSWEIGYTGDTPPNPKVTALMATVEQIGSSSCVFLGSDK
jgi:ribonuclease BN (tRNA processing enzyme)